MKDRRSTNTGKPDSKSKKAVSARKSMNPAPKKTSAQQRQSGVSQSVGAKQVIPQNASKLARKKRTGPVVGMKGSKPSSLRAVRNPKIVTIRKKEKSPFPTSVVFTSIIVTVLFLFMMMNYAEIDKYNSEIGRLEARITKLKNEEHDLGIRLDKKDNLVYIEEYATNELGMVKAETLPREYVSLLPPDRSEIIKYEDGEEGGFGFLLAGIGEVLSDFMK